MNQIENNTMSWERHDPSGQIIAVGITIVLSDDNAEKCGAYHNDNVKGLIAYDKTTQEIFIGVAGTGTEITSFAPINESSPEEQAYARMLVNNALAQ